MTRTGSIKAGVLALVLTIAVAGFAVAAAPARRVATLSGGEDGDPDATGRAVFRVSPAENKICFRITYEGVMEPGYGSIVSGRPYATKSEVELFNGDQGGRPSPIEGCARDVERSILERIKERPRVFSYVQFRYGASQSGLEGQLRRPN